MTNGPFEDAALALAARGLAVIPVGGDDGKTPLLAWGKWRRPPGKNFLAKLEETHSGANIGILTGLSNLTVVDIDDAALLDSMLGRFGPTPLMIETPSGGRHLYYRGAGEGCRNLRESERFPVDVKGAGGFVVAPPSIRPSGPHAGKFYRIISGSWDDLPRLPQIRPGSLPARHATPWRPGAAGEVLQGARNSTIFKRLLRELKGCDSPDALLDVARGINDSFVPPLPEEELMRAVSSVWGYEARGENWIGAGARAVTTAGDGAILKANAEAGFFLVMLKLHRGNKTEPFAVSPEGLRRADFMPGWGERRYGDVRDWLVRAGFLTIVHQGGTGRGDPRLFLLSNPAQKKPPKMMANITKTPSPLDISARRFCRQKTDDGVVDLITLAGGEAPPRRIDLKSFAAKLKAARTARGATQAEIARQAGITRAALANIENAHYPASPALQRRLGGILTELAA